jgi:hypothetical protein
MKSLIRDGPIEVTGTTELDDFLLALEQAEESRIPKAASKLKSKAEAPKEEAAGAAENGGGAAAVREEEAAEAEEKVKKGEEKKEQPESRVVKMDIDFK